MAFHLVSITDSPLVFQSYKRYSRVNGFSAILALCKNTIHRYVSLLREQYVRFRSVTTLL